MGVDVKRFMIPLKGGQELCDGFRFRLFQLNIFHDPEGVISQMKDESTPAGEDFFLLVELERIVSWDGTEDDTAVPTDRIADRSHTCMPCAFLAIKLAFAPLDFAAGFGFVRTLAPIR